MFNKINQNIQTSRLSAFVGLFCLGFVCVCVYVFGLFSLGVCVCVCFLLFDQVNSYTDATSGSHLRSSDYHCMLDIKHLYAVLIFMYPHK